jgi:hypothetical protein
MKKYQNSQPVEIVDDQKPPELPIEPMKDNSKGKT